VTAVDDIPIARTPEGGYGAQMPLPVLESCEDPLADGAPDLRGTWRVIAIEHDGEALPADSPMWQYVERIEQAGDRVVITGGGIVHDMRADGTFDHGVHDVMAADFTTPIVVAAAFEDGALVLRPQGIPGVEVRRWRDGDNLVWRYHVMFTARLARVDASG
jgi:hypothetical protein